MVMLLSLLSNHAFAEEPALPGKAVYAHAHIGELREDPAYRVVAGSGVAAGWGLSMVQMLQNRRSLVRAGQSFPFPKERTAMLQPLLTPSAVGLQLRW